VALLGGKYDLGRSLGEGAMGAVWSARNVLTAREVAVKLISKNLIGSEDAKRRLLREASACGRLTHPNIVQVLDVGTNDDGDPFLVMELLRGRSLAQRLSEGPVSAGEITVITLGIARGLAEAHAAGVVHRDLKPANVFLHEDPHLGVVVKVVDFGVSKILGNDDSSTMTGMAIGSPAYMSPEQARGDVKKLDHRSDIWSFGVLLFELIAGQRPFVGESAFEVVSEILKGPIPRIEEIAPQADAELARIVASCLVRKLDERASSASEIVSMLERKAARAGVEVSRRSLGPPVGVALVDAPVAADAAQVTREAVTVSASFGAATSTTPFLAVAAQPRRRRLLPVAVTVGVLGGLGIAMAIVFSVGSRNANPAAGTNSASPDPLSITTMESTAVAGSLSSSPAATSDEPVAAASTSATGSSKTSRPTGAKVPIRPPPVVAPPKPPPPASTSKPSVRFTDPG
jgi:eukaryotic-like serine/threonine-protein kinase